MKVQTTMIRKQIVPMSSFKAVIPTLKIIQLSR
jgi:hypothetical protein